MALDFSLGQIQYAEFGVGFDLGAGRQFRLVPADGSAQNALQEMASATWDRLSREVDEPRRYGPGETHASQDYLTVRLADPLVSEMRQLHEAENIPTEGEVLKDTWSIELYFARFTDDQGRRLTGVHRAGQFKGVLKKRLISFAADAVRLIEDKVFRLDDDFDFLIDAHRLHVLRPAAFELACNMQEAIRAAVPGNISKLQLDLDFVDVEALGIYIGAHTRAARYLASICSEGESENISKAKLKAECRRNGVKVSEREGVLSVEAGHELAFLEVLDRRRYAMTLVDGTPENYRAASRQRILVAGD